MSKTKFTSGEWIIETPKLDDYAYLIATEDYGVCTTVTSRETDKANAHLIAAAPKLYEMLERFLPLYADGNGSFEYNKGSEGMGDDVIKLLAEARGE